MSKGNKDEILEQASNDTVFYFQCCLKRLLLFTSAKIFTFGTGLEKKTQLLAKVHNTQRINYLKMNYRTLLFWFLSDYRCGVFIFIVLLVI